MNRTQAYPHVHGLLDVIPASLSPSKCGIEGCYVQVSPSSIILFKLVAQSPRKVCSLHFN